MTPSCRMATGSDDSSGIKAKVKVNGSIEGNKVKDSVSEEYAEDHFCNEDGRFSQASQGSVCHRQ